MIESLLLALSLSMDCFAISIVLSFSKECQKFKRAAVMAASFGIFQFIFFVAGAFLGTAAVGFLSDAGKWAAFLLLLFVGGKMIKEGLGKDCDCIEETQFKEGLKKSGNFLVSVILLSIADSIDAGAAGLSFSLLHETSIFSTAIIVGIMSFLISALGFAAGRKLGEKFGKRAEILGGLALIAIGVSVII